MNRAFLSSFFLILFLFFNHTVNGQESAQQHDESVNGALKVFMDCRCDMDYIRQQIPYVNYVRDVKEAEVYVLVTSQNAGSGGNRFTFNYQGLKQFAGLNDTLVYTSSPDMTSAEVRENQVDMLKAGLIRYGLYGWTYFPLYSLFNKAVAAGLPMISIFSSSHLTIDPVL